MEITNKPPNENQKSSCGSHNCCGSDHKRTCIRKYFITDTSSYKPKIIPKIFQFQKTVVKKEVIESDLDCQITDCEQAFKRKRSNPMNTIKESYNLKNNVNLLMSVNEPNMDVKKMCDRVQYKLRRVAKTQNNNTVIEPVSRNIANEIMESSDEVQIISFDERYDDPGSWPRSLTMLEVDYIVDGGPIRPKVESYPKTKKNEGFSEAVYERQLRGNPLNTDWLIYSVSKNSLFCFYCKLFASGEGDEFCTVGFQHWRYVRSKLRCHENSKLHRDCHLIYTDRFLKVKMAKPRLDNNVIEIS